MLLLSLVSASPKGASKRERDQERPGKVVCSPLEKSLFSFPKKMDELVLIFPGRHNFLWGEGIIKVGSIPKDKA